MHHLAIIITSTSSLVYDLTTLTYTELKHAQWQQHMALLDMVDRHGWSRSVALVVFIKSFEAKICYFFAIFDILTALATC